MKQGNFAKIVLLGSALAAPGYAEKVQLDQLPPQLQEKIRAQTGSARIEDIDRDVRNGKTTYEVAFKNAQGQNTELVFEDTGNLAGSSPNTTLDSRKISYSELPVPVRRTADSQIAGGEVNDVERKVRNGRITYGVGFKGPGGTGPQREIRIDSQGNLLRGHRNSAYSAATSTAPAPSSNPVSTPRTISYNELPQTVRSVAESHLNHGAVDRVERRLQNSEIDYTISFKRDDGQYQQMVIAEDGRILGNQVTQPLAVGSPATTQSDAATSTAPAVAHRVALRNSVAVDLSQVPPEIRRVIRERSGNGQVEEILRGEWSGKQVYQVTLTEGNNRSIEMQVDQNGQVLYDPRGTRIPAASPAANLLNNLGRAILDNKP